MDDTHHYMHAALGIAPRGTLSRPNTGSQGTLTPRYRHAHTHASTDIHLETRYIPGLTSRWVGGTTQLSLERQTRLSPCRESPSRRCMQSVTCLPMDLIRESGWRMRIEPFHIPLWNLKREQHISLHASAWYPICPNPKRPFPWPLHMLSSQPWHEERVSISLRCLSGDESYNGEALGCESESSWMRSHHVSG